jgi:hypothetical protein
MYRYNYVKKSVASARLFLYIPAVIFPLCSCLKAASHRFEKIGHTKTAIHRMLRVWQFSM